MTYISKFTMIVVAAVVVNAALCTWLYSTRARTYSPPVPPAVEGGSKSKGQCYSYSQKGEPRLPLRPMSARKKLGCERRLPGAIVVGVKKGGTGALRFFLRYHPQVSFTNGEPRYFSSRDFAYSKDAYRKEMAYSTPGQVTVEGTPSYFDIKTSAKRIKAALPNVKLLLLLRDPVKRAISDYAHVEEVSTKLRRTYNDSVHRPDILRGSRYEMAPTFSDSVLHPNGTLKTYNLLLVKGRYAEFLSRWLKHFPLERILILDGGSFSKEPVPTLKKVEEFLGIAPYFTADHFKFIKEKGFYCLHKPVKNNCLASNKGRAPPQVTEKVIQTLQDYYHPFNKQLNSMLNRTFSWST